MSILKNIGIFFGARLMRKYKKHYLINASTDWHMLLIIFIIVTIVAVSFSVYLFMQINKGEIFVVKQDESVLSDSIDRTLLKETLSLYEEKSRNFEELKINRPSVVDPSL
jgi:type II secretory pathway component PulC